MSLAMGSGRNMPVMGRPVSRMVGSGAVASARRLGQPATLPEVPNAAIICGTVIFGALGVGMVFAQPDPWLLLLLSVTAGLVLSMSRWELLVGLMIAVGFFAGSLRMSYGGWAAYLIPEVVVAFVLLRWISGRISSGANLLSRTSVALPFALFALYCVLELLHPEAPLVRSLFGFRSWFFYTALLFAGYEGYRDRRQVDFLARIIIILGLMTSTYGIWQWLAGPERLAELGGWHAVQARTMQWGGPDGTSVMRVSASFSTSGAFSANMALITTLALGSFLSPASSVRWRLLCGSAIAVMACGMAVSGSRMGPAVLIVSVAVILVLFRRFRALIGIAVAWGGGLWLISKVSGTILLPRFATMLEPAIFFWKWTDPLMMGIVFILPHPLGQGLGYAAGLPNFLVGSDFVDRLRTGAVADSGYGLAGLELGLVGILLLLFFALQLSRGALRAWQKLPDAVSKDAFLGPAAWAVSFPVTLLFAAMTASAPLSMYQWILIGMLLRAGAAERPHTPTRGPLLKARPKGPTMTPRARGGSRQPLVL